MNANNPSPVQPAVAKYERRLAFWLLFGLLMFITPVLLVGIGVVSMFGLSREAAHLRREVMAATDTQWNTKVQLSAGWATLGAARTVLRFIDHENIADARLALAAVRAASVGVYEANVRNTNIAHSRLFTETDRKMQRRGWTRMVGVAEDKETVLIYVSDSLDAGGRVDLCLAVVSGHELVVVSAEVDADVLAKLAARHMPKDGRREKGKTAKMKF